MANAEGLRGETKRLTLSVEEVVVTRRQVPGETVRVSAVTRETKQDIDEALVHEHVEVERVAVGRTIDRMPDVREEDGVTIIPVVEEMLVVERRLVLKEEIRIRRVRVGHRHLETVLLRQQEAVVSRDTPPPTDCTTQKTLTGERIQMTQETIVAIYDTAAHAQLAIRDLETANVPVTDISHHAKSGSMTGATSSPAAVHDKGFWSSLFGTESDHDTAIYDRSIESGATVVTVKVADAQYDRIAAILEKHNPIDIDERSAQYGLAGGTGVLGNGTRNMEPARTGTGTADIDASGPASSPARVEDGVARTGLGLGAAEGRDSETLQLAEEQLNVGRRAVQGGTTRIRRFTTSKPVEENVTLHSEKVVLDRRPVTDGSLLGNSDFSDRTIEMTATNEEAVVSKTARVVEEVGLHREASDRVETVRETLRKDEVEVVEDPTKRVVETDRTSRKI